MSSILSLIIKLIGGFAFGYGLFMVLADILKLPTMKTLKARNAILNGASEESSTINVWLENITKFVSKHLKMDPFQKQELTIDLKTAQIEMSPEMFKARGYVFAGVFIVLSIPFLFFVPIFGIAIALMAIIMYRSTTNIKSKIRAIREEIEEDLPRLVATIQKKLSYDRSINSILTDFLPVAGPALKKELEITLADINSGNEEAAITRLEARVGSPMMSDVCRGFITMIHGDVADVYWSSLGIKFSDMRRQKIKVKAMRVPKKANRLSVFILMAFIATFFVVIISQLVSSMGVFF